MNAGRFYTIHVAEAALRIRIPTSTIYRWVKDGRLTSFEYNDVIYLNPDELHELAALRDTHGRLPSRRLHSAPNSENVP